MVSAICHDQLNPPQNTFVVLGHLTATTPHLAGRQGGQRVEVAHHTAGLPVRTDEVLALGDVDPGLATDGRVDHADQRRADVHHGDAAVP